MQQVILIWLYSISDDCRVCGSKFFMGGHEEMKKVYLAKFQNFYYINPKKMGGHRPPRPPQFRTPCVLVLKTFIQILIFRGSILHSQNSFRCPCKYIQRYHLKPLRSLKKIVLQFEDYICYELPLKFLFGVANVLRMSLSKMSCTFYK